MKSQEANSLDHNHNQPHQLSLLHQLQKKLKKKNTDLLEYKLLPVQHSVDH